MPIPCYRAYLCDKEVCESDLYRIWADAESGDADIEAILGEICDQKGGVYEYEA